MRPARPRRVATTAVGRVGEGVPAVVVALPSRLAAPAGVAGPQPPPGEIGSVGRSAMACPLSLVLSAEISRCQRGCQGRLAGQMCLDLRTILSYFSDGQASLTGELLQRPAHRVRRLATAGSGALADRAAFQGDDPSVEAGPVGVERMA
jgi:hypothetical protein